MNKLFKMFLSLVVLAGVAITARAQEMPGVVPMPVEEAVKTGTLPNGLTYYIRHNETPKGQADFYIAQKVGSILEEDNQRGLAHFLEHMCFNGTENFPEKGIINWLESIGVKFGYNLNAYTSVDETVYNISSVPVARQSVQDSCLLILHDWACALTLDPKEIDAERGVIHEEWRRSNAGQMRILEELLPKVYPNNKYGVRLPIGTMDVVDNFPPQAIIDYYHTWYRPDQQGIIVVGDIDPDYIEGKIKELFSTIPMPENAKERVYVPVEDTEGTIVAIGSDPEMPAASAMVAFKFDNLLPRELNNTSMHYPIAYMKDIVGSMFRSRLSDLASKPDAPFAVARMSIDNFFLAKTKDALMLDITAKDADITKAIAAVYRELLRASRGGFTPGEFERANAELASQYQKMFDNRNNTQTELYSRELVRSFIDNEPIPGIEAEKQIMDAMTQMMPLEQVNALLPELIKPDNRIVMVMMPESFGTPTEEQILAAMAAVEAEEIEPYRDEMKSEPLIPALPTPGKITAESHNAQWDATEFTLSNGVKVLVKPTTLKENEIVFSAEAIGGYAVLPEEYASSIIFMPYAMGSHGLGTYTKSDLNKYLQGKQAAVGVSADEYSRTVTGRTTKQDLPTMMELIYATFTEFNMFPDEFQAAQNKFKGILANQETTPDYAYGKLLTETTYKAKAKGALSTAHIDAADSEQTDAIVKAMLADASDFTFIFVGNIDLDTFKPLLEQYIATLPTGTGSIKYAPVAGFDATPGQVNEKQQMAMSTLQTWAYYAISGNVPYTAADRVKAQIATSILSKRLLDKVREDMGATYSIGAYGGMQRLGASNVLIQIPFPMKPEMKDEVLAAIDTIFNELGTSITAEEVNKQKEFLVKEATSAREENTGWLNGIAGASMNGIDTFNGAIDTINAITVDDVQNYWNNLRSQGNLIQVILDPAE